MDKKLLDRINFLARKSRAEGLTKEEAEEQQKLRRDYIEAYKGNLRKTLDNIVIVDADGNRKILKKKNGIDKKLS